MRSLAEREWASCATRRDAFVSSLPSSSARGRRDAERTVACGAAGVQRWRQTGQGRASPPKGAETLRGTIGMHRHERCRWGADATHGTTKPVGRGVAAPRVEGLCPLSGGRRAESALRPLPNGLDHALRNGRVVNATTMRPGVPSRRYHLRSRAMDRLCCARGDRYFLWHLWQFALSVAAKTIVPPASVLPLWQLPHASPALIFSIEIGPLVPRFILKIFV
jgi:hypothetical protein